MPFIRFNIHSDWEFSEMKSKDDMPKALFVSIARSYDEPLKLKLELRRSLGLRASNTNPESG